MLRGFFGEMKIPEVEVQLVKTHETVRIRIDIHFEIVDGLRCDPPGTKFGSRKAGAIENDNVDTGLTEFPGTGRARRSAPNNDYVNVLHGLLVPCGIRRIKVIPGPRHVIITARREQDLIELQCAGLERGR